LLLTLLLLPVSGGLISPFSCCKKSHPPWVALPLRLLLAFDFVFDFAFDCYADLRQQKSHPFWVVSFRTLWNACLAFVFAFAPRFGWFHSEVSY
jgi:hypothetical protein